MSNSTTTPKSPLNFVAPLSLEVCRQRLQQLQEPSGTGWKLQTEVWRSRGGMYEFRIWRIPAALNAPRPTDLSAEGMLRAGEGAQTYVLGKLKGQFSLLDDLSLREIALLISLLVIGTMGLRMAGVGVSVGLVGILLALGFVGWRWLDFTANRRHLVRHIREALNA